MGGKGKQSKRFMFLFTLLIGLIIGVGSGVFFLIFKSIIFKVLGQEISLISSSQLIKFLGATTLMSTAYLLSNWLFSLRKNIYIFIPLISSMFQTILFMIWGRDLNSLLNAFYLSSVVFFVLALTACLAEVIPKPKQSIMQAEYT
jgi:hypothetical protein